MTPTGRVRLGATPCCPQSGWHSQAQRAGAAGAGAGGGSQVKELRLVSSLLVEIFQ